ncbi:hypothetical protein ACWDUD_08925 [Rhodococcus sp. NPDC003382]
MLIAALAGASVATLVLSVLYLLVLREEPEAPEPVAAPPSTVTVTAPAPTVTVTAPTSPVRVVAPPTSTPATTPVTTTSTPGPPAIEQVRVFTERGGRGHLVGPDMYQATTYGTAGVVFRWRSIDESGAEIWNETCQVVSTVTGPGDYSHTDRSAACSGRVRAHELVLDAPGDYTITTTVIGADGATTVGTAGFQVIPE